MINIDNQYFGKDLEAMSVAVNYNNWIFDEFSHYFWEMSVKLVQEVEIFQKSY